VAITSYLPDSGEDKVLLEFPLGDAAAAHAVSFILHFGCKVRTVCLNLDEFHPVVSRRVLVRARGAHGSAHVAEYDCAPTDLAELYIYKSVRIRVRTATHLLDDDGGEEEKKMVGGGTDRRKYEGIKKKRETRGQLSKSLFKEQKSREKVGKISIQ
jgi:hypothetical protein